MRTPVPGSTTTVAALNPRLIAAVHPRSSSLISAAAGELGRRAEDLREDDADGVMEQVRDALAVLGELFLEDGPINDIQHSDKAAQLCNTAGWAMQHAAAHITAALAAE